MASVRSVIFRNGFIYHIYNRGVERRPIFLTSRDHDRFISLLEYYRFDHVPKSYSHYLALSLAERALFRQRLDQKPLAVDILAYCLMQNHFHILLKQNLEGGIHQFVANVANAYAKYFNTKRHRVGPLYQGPFKAVRIETDEQLLHVSRYIHINSVVSGLVTTKGLVTYPWSSFLDYLGKTQSPFVVTKPVLDYFKTKEKYSDFVFDQVGYAKELEKIKHLILEEV